MKRIEKKFIDSKVSKLGLNLSFNDIELNKHKNKNIRINKSLCFKLATGLLLVSLLCITIIVPISLNNNTIHNEATPSLPINPSQSEVNPEPDGNTSGELTPSDNIEGSIESQDNVSSDQVNPGEPENPGDNNDYLFRFSTISFNGINYLNNYLEVDSIKIQRLIATITIDEVEIEIYKLKDIEIKNSIAVKFNGTENYYSYDSN